MVFFGNGKNHQCTGKGNTCRFYNLPELTERIDEVENFHFNIADALFDSDHLQINNELKIFLIVLNRLQVNLNTPTTSFMTVLYPLAKSFRRQLSVGFLTRGE